jgi:phosphate transport system permease protein
VSPAAERLFVAAARLCAVIVVAVQPLVVVILVVASAVALAHRALSFSPSLVWLIAATLGLGLIGATLGSALGVGAALYAVEIASPGARQTIKALVGALHAVPAVGFGVAAAGILVITPMVPNVAVTFAIASVVIVTMIASVVFVQSRRALSDLPVEVREVAAAAGADAVNTTVRAVLPALERKIAGIWWSAFALALGEATALQIIFGAAAVKAQAFGLPSMPGTLATTLLQVGSQARGAAVSALAPLALLLLLMALTAVLLGRRAVGQVTWP